MKNIVVSKVKDMDQAVRAWAGKLFGRVLGDDEEITIMAFPPQAAPSGAAAREAHARMDAVLDRAAANLERVPPEEFEAAVDEAMEHVRRWER